MEIEIEIPADWQKRRIRDVGEVVTGRTPSTKRDDFYGGDCKLIYPVDLDNGKYVTTAHKRLTSLGLGECRALPKDTVLVGCIGNVGKLGMIGDHKSATNQQINSIICNQRTRTFLRDTRARARRRPTNTFRRSLRSQMPQRRKP